MWGPPEVAPGGGLGRDTVTAATISRDVGCRRVLTVTSGGTGVLMPACHTELMLHPCCRPALYVGKHAASFYALTSLVHGSVALVVSI